MSVSSQPTVQPIPARPTALAVPPMIERSLEDRIRREFFARASSNATRYGVTPDDVLSHLRGAHLTLTPGPARVLAFMDDIVLAVACVRNHPRAWHDAWGKHESAMIRACHARLDHASAVVFTRRFWVDMHFISTHGEPVEADPKGDGDEPASTMLAPWPLRFYVGVRPLRVWLSDRLLARLEHEIATGAIVSTARSHSKTDGAGRVKPIAEQSLHESTEALLGPGTSSGAHARKSWISPTARRRATPVEPVIRLRLVDGGT
ncbi:MAG: hypothetical protein JNL80_10305 [Phycisphaerae bacterium]|jgi:hypothetical protein|nr:hypothetical protein [Phycisphaerae bacterium]